MTTYTSQPAEADSFDTFIGKNSPTANYNGQDMLIGYSADIARALLKFNLAIGTNPPPSNAQVNSVTIYLYCNTYTVTRTINLYRCLKNWAESATWNTYSVGNSWTTAGCGGVDSDFNSTVLGSVSVASTGLKTITLNADGIAVVQNWINGTYSNNGFLIKDTTEATNKNTFSDSTNATAANRPKIVIEYSIPDSDQTYTAVF